MRKVPVFFPAMIFLLFSVTVRAQVLSWGEPEELAMSSERLARLDEVVQATIEEEEVPGAVVLVARRGKLVYRKAFGDRVLVPEREPMTVETIFDMASLTKVIATATSIMILVEEGKLSLTDPVSEHLTSFSSHGKSSITILQLLTHYSGLRPDLDLDRPWEGYETAIELASKERLVASPGKEFIYSDINYVVLAEIVNKVSGKHLHKFSSERIFERLGMNNTGFSPPTSLQHRIAPTHSDDGEILRGVVHDPTAYRMGGCAGHAGLFSTVDDTAIYAQMILNRGEYGGVRILSPLSILKMTSPQSSDGADDWRGIGFDIRTRLSGSRGDLFPVGSFGHTGFTGISMWIDPYTSSFVLIFTSRLYPDGQGDVTRLRKRIASVVAASMTKVPSLRKLYHPD